MKANSKLTVIGIVAVLASGCTRNPSSDKTAIEIEPLKKQVSELASKLQIAQQTESDLVKRINLLEFYRAIEKDNSTELDPASKQYGIVKTNLGELLVSIDNLTPYGDGYKLRLMIGNPNMVTYNGAKLKVQWAEKPRWGSRDFDAAKWNNSIQTKDVEIANEILPGAWNPVEIVISPATAAQTGYLTLSAELNSLSLRRSSY